MKKKSELIKLEIFNHVKRYYHILYKMSYQSYSVSLKEGQEANLARAYNNISPTTIRLKNDKLKGIFPLLLTKTQKKELIKQIKLELI